MDIIGIGILFSVIICQTTSGYYKGFVEEVYKWKKIEYENLPLPENSWIGPYRYYIPENNNIGSTAYHPASGLIIGSILRLRPGIPSTVGAFCVSDYRVGSSPKFWGFPNYQLNTLEASDFAEGPLEENQVRRGSVKPYKHHGSHHYVHKIPLYVKPSPPTTTEKPLELKRIISVFHITVDEKCNRVFFMDNGLMRFYQNTTYAPQKPALWVVDLPLNGCETRNFPIRRRVELPDRIVAKGSNGFTHVTLDHQSDLCDDLFLYITNSFAHFLVVYDYKNDDFWYFDHETFQPVVAESYITWYLELYGAFNFQMLLGIYSVALGFEDENGDRTAYYTSAATTAQFAVSTKILKDKRKSPANFNPDDFRIMGYRGCERQSLMTVIDYTYGVMFYGEIQSNQIRCWNINKPLNPDNIDVVFESDIYTNCIQMFLDSRGYLWLHCGKVPLIFASDMPLNLSTINNRVYRVKVSDAIRGTVCDDGDLYKRSVLGE